MQVLEDIQSVGLAILTFTKDSAIHWIRICSPESWAVCCGDWWLQLCSVSTLHQVKLLTLLQLVLLICVDESETITTCSQLSKSLITGPVFVTTVQVWIVSL